MPTDIDFKAMARGIRAGGIAAGMEAGRLNEAGEDERAQALDEAASTLGELSSQLEAWRLKEAQSRRVTISTAALLDILQGLELHHAGLLRLAESLAHAGLKAGDIEQVRHHASALEGMREDLALSVPEPLE